LTEAERNKAVEFLVGIDLLFDARECNQLVRELGRVHRVQRVLILQLRGKQGQELVEIRRKALLCRVGFRLLVEGCIN
jgi:hypothetical protein